MRRALSGREWEAGRVRMRPSWRAEAACWRAVCCAVRKHGVERVEREGAGRGPPSWRAKAACWRAWSCRCISITSTRSAWNFRQLLAPKSTRESCS
eukprot:3290774-Rhodomonas_salina.2